MRIKKEICQYKKFFVLENAHTCKKIKILRSKVVCTGVKMDESKEKSDCLKEIVKNIMSGRSMLKRVYNR